MSPLSLRQPESIAARASFPYMTLWTPDGEHPVNKPEAESPTPQETSADTPPTGQGEPDMTPEQEQQAREMAAGLSEARQQLLEANVSDVVANHAFGIYELAAIHLTAEEPDMVASRLAIDGLGSLVEGLAGRLGEAEPTLTEALQQIRMMFVQRTTQLKKAAEAKASPDGSTDETASGAATAAEDEASSEGN